MINKGSSKTHSSSLESSGGRASRRILYLTFDGILEPLGRSQVLPYLFGLSDKGFRYTVISLERGHDLSDSASVQDLERELTKHNIRWIRLAYRIGGLKAVFKNCYLALRAARKVIRQEPIQLVHARSYVPALMGWILRRLYDLPYIFDMRGYWVDELADEGRWFNNRVAYGLGKLIERKLVVHSAAIVTLTRIQANDLRSGLLKNFPERPIEVITTCADYEEFDLTKPPHSAVPQQIHERLQGKLTVGMVGSINASYCLAESFFLFQCLLEERPDAHLLCLTRQVSEMAALIREHGIPESAYTLTTVRYREMSDWLRHMNWALLLLKSRFSKRGSMPTKLAEFFAAGVRPIQYGCNPEVSQKVLEAGSGIVLCNLSPEDLHQAAKKVAATPLRQEETVKAREATRPHFSLEAGVKNYEELLTRLELDGRL